MPGPVDPYPTVKLSVPYLKELLERLRDPKQERVIMIVHCESREEGEWVLANTAARLARSKIATYGPEMQRPTEIIEQALREKAAVALIGEIRRVDDAHAMRTASALGLRIVGYVTVKTRNEFDDLVAELGPWRSHNVSALSRF